MASAEDACHPSVEALDEPLGKLRGRIYDACIESLQLIANSVANLQPIPDLPDTRRLVGDIASRDDELHRSAVGDADGCAAVLGFMRTTAHLGALADAIHDCRDKANALDWADRKRTPFNFLRVG